MHFNILASLPLLISLATAAPSPGQSPNIHKRQELPNVKVKVYTDDLCNDATGSFYDNKPKCINLDDLSVDVLSINAEVDDTILNVRCSWTVHAYPEVDCKGDGPEGWGMLREGSCRHLGSKPDPIKSFGIYEAGPC